MRLFLAAVWTNNYMPTQARHEKLLENEREIIKSIPHVLESYHYVKNEKYVNTMRQQGAKVFLDSGAFSAHSLDAHIDIDQYCEYVIRNRDILRQDDGVYMASVLDGIGDALKTYQNQIYMERKGAKPLPCFHFGEPAEYLEWYVKNYSYITIGGLVKKTKKDQERWLDEIWNDYLIDGSGRAKLKIHGFGMTSPDLMKRYPWHSCDSSSWIAAAAFGSIYTSEHGPIAVSEHSPAKHDAGRHLTTLTDIERNSVESMLALKGFNLERLSTVYESRAAYNCLGYCELNKLVDEDGKKNNYVFSCTKSQQLF